MAVKIFFLKINFPQPREEDNGCATAGVDWEREHRRGRKRRKKFYRLEHPWMWGSKLMA